jgi:hypothetical protein
MPPKSFAKAGEFAQAVKWAFFMTIRGSFSGTGKTSMAFML